ncbi:MAG TPA: hypothetical protein VNE39_27695 [Planctomycetota bacterium]|nr:hypothetical protein [Planctomycetota bacterium]
MTKKEATRLWPEARRLYASGYSLTRISDELKASRNTLASWRAKDGGSDLDWDELRNKQLSADPYSPVRIARQRVEALLKQAPERLDDSSYDDQLTKAIKNLDWVEARYGSADRILEVVEQQAIWARANVRPDEFKCAKCGEPHDALAILHDVNDRFMADVRRGELEISV